MKNAAWIKQCREVAETMPGESDEARRTVSECERYINYYISRQARKTAGVKKFKVGKTELKGWWNADTCIGRGEGQQGLEPPTLPLIP